LLFIGAIALSLGTRLEIARSEEALPLELEAKIPLGDVKGRIDHLAFDAKRRRLFVAELGNDSVGVVDLDGRKVVHTISGLKEPQGVAYVPSTDMLYVANGGDGSVRLFQAGDYGAAAQIDLGDDADNIRVDTADDRVLVGYGRGALAVIDPGDRRKIAGIPLRPHPQRLPLVTASGHALLHPPPTHR